MMMMLVTKRLTGADIVCASGDRLCRLRTTTAIDTDTVDSIITHEKYVPTTCRKHITSNLTRKAVVVPTTTTVL